MDRAAVQQRYEHVDADSYRNQHEDAAQGHYAVDGGDREGCYAVEGETEHLAERVLGRSGLALGADFLDRGRWKANHGDYAPQVEVALAIFLQFEDHTSRHETEVGVVEYGLDTHRGLELIERLGCVTLHERIGLTRGTDTVDYVVAVVIGIEHLGDTFERVLQIDIDCDDSICHLRSFDRREHAGHNGILMTDIAREVETVTHRVLLVKAGDDAPGGVAAPVVDKEEEAVGSDKAISNQAVHESHETRGRDWEHVLLIIAWGDNGELRHPWRGAVRSRGSAAGVRRCVVGGFHMSVSTFWICKDNSQICKIKKF